MKKFVSVNRSTISVMLARSGRWIMSSPAFEGTDRESQRTSTQYSCVVGLMRTRFSRLTSFACVLLLSLPAIALGAGPNIDVEYVTVAGSFLTSRIDNNQDGQGSSWCTLQIKGGYQGSSMQQCINEDVFAGITAECPGGVIIVTPSTGTGMGVRTFPNALDQIYLRLTERELCVNAFGGVEGTDEGVVVGGTGRYEGAVGSYSLEYTGQLLYGDETAVPPQNFGSILGTGTFTIERQ
jgi:hypothetical protein